ncbi:MAG: S46 family peptidase [Bacteroidales bacterium]
MKRVIVAFILSFTLFSSIVKGDEGMWLPSAIKERLADMQAKGLKVSDQELYNMLGSSLKDAIVRFGGGCTGEIISPQGLLLTNHHCGFSVIQSHSSLENDYLKDGFWAFSMSEELPNPGLSVKFLIKMEEVTHKVVKGLSATTTDSEEQKIIKANIKEIVKEATSGNHYEASVESIYYGNRYFLFVYELFTDVRLVGAPPSSIGKFGGDSDNWMWPRHTGDFALYRVYAGENNRPADYSPNNRPYQPKRFFSISAKGIEEGDFTLVYGYPGRTEQYIISDAVRYTQERSNPHKINLRNERLKIIKREMERDPAIRIKYASKSASISNAWKKWQGETKGLVRPNTVANKELFESQFNDWAKDQPQYNGLVRKLSLLYSRIEPYRFVLDYYNEAVKASELFNFAGALQKELNKKSGSTLSDRGKGLIDKFYKDYFLPIDRDAFIAVMREYEKNIENDLKPPFYRNELKRHGSIDKYISHLYQNSIYRDSSILYSTLQKSSYNTILEKDPISIMNREFTNFITNEIRPTIISIEREINKLYKIYIRAIMEFDREREFYPDANRTLRITYGNVMGYYPSDGVYYHYQSTLDGVMEKDNPNIYDYAVPTRLKELFEKKEYGRWGSNDGKMPICFLASNHTSGGNSGSPVINGNGELIGINFDRVWEGTMSDINFDPAMCRNVSVDIRYILFIIDKFAGAGYLIDEMDIKF